MGDTTIEWADKVWNPTRGCSRVSTGCNNCYAMREARRHDHPGGSYEGLTRVVRVGKRGSDWSGVVRLVPEQLAAPLRWRKPRRIFVNSMSDLFHESLTFEDIAKVYGVMTAAQQHTFQVLTKRPKRRIEFHAWREAHREDAESLDFYAALACEIRAWPLPNVWEGTSVEDQATADERIPLLLQTPTAVRFVSYEPALGPVDFAPWLYCDRDEAQECPPCRRLDWLIVGGESGPGARPFDPEWARATIDQCRAAGVRVFVKQLGALPGALDLHDPKGGEPSEWPRSLRVREFPARGAGVDHDLSDEAPEVVTRG